MIRNDQIYQMTMNRLDRLISQGVDVIASAQWDSDIEELYLDNTVYGGWYAQCLVFLADFPGDNHIYTTEFKGWAQGGSPNSVSAAVSILKALKSDLELGYLSTIRELIHADMFADFLDMATYLQTEGYKDAAAVMAGGVLEQHLRQLCPKHAISLEVDSGNGPRPRKADSMNAELARGNVYTRGEQKQVTAWLDLRNKAAHAQYNEYSMEEVLLFLQGLRNFVIRHPA